MNVVELILDKRRSKEHSAGEVAALVRGYSDGAVPDYQMAAWLMAACCRGLSPAEAFALTEAILHSGEQVDLSLVAPVVGDKHSTGGVGDKTTLVLAPLVSAAGLPMAKMAGHTLGFTGGTLDKLESIPGMRVQLDKEEFLASLMATRLVIAGQSPTLCPADGKLYALRDVTGTIDQPALIASSVMSKKIASGAMAIALDVKVGHGAFMKTLEEGRELAALMLRIGHAFGRRVSALITAMDQPLGCAVGNALEVREAIETLRGQGPADLRELCFALGTQLLLLAGIEHGEALARGRLERALHSGEALTRFGAFVERQGGKREIIDNLDLLPQAPFVESVRAPRGGFVAHLDALAVALGVQGLGAGRLRKGDPVDHAVGVVLHRKVGDPVETGQPLFTIHARTAAALAMARAQLLAAYAFSSDPVAVPASPVMLKVES